MKTYIVLYLDPDRPFLESDDSNEPWGFRCRADDYDHAEEQCVNAYPSCQVLWVVETDRMDVALDDYNRRND